MNMTDLYLQYTVFLCMMELHAAIFSLFSKDISWYYMSKMCYIESFHATEVLNACTFSAISLLYKGKKVMIHLFSTQPNPAPLTFMLLKEL